MLHKLWEFIKDWSSFGVILFIASLTALGWRGCHIRTVNKLCDAACMKKGYPVGELVPDMKHDVCVCWPTNVGQSVYFLFEKD